MKELPKNTDENGRDEKGRFTTGNKGKPKGAINNATRETKELISLFLLDKADELPKIWNSLTDRDKATLFIHLSKLVLPRQMPEKDLQKQEPRVFNIPDIGNREIKDL